MPAILRNNLWLLIILAIAAILLLWQIDARGINEWDEAQNGVNAWEMYHNGDCINTYYAGHLDTWNAKPPLLIWLIVGSYHLFGFNAFALRLPAVLCTLGFFFFAFRFTRLVPDKRVVIVACGILLTCKAVLGVHTGLTGDYDALLLCFLTASAYYFFRFAEMGDRRAIYLTAIFTGLAFYAKGPAALVYVPGFLLYGCIRRGNLRWLLHRQAALAAVIVIAFIGSWIALVAAFGRYPAQSHYGSHNTIETMLVNDVWQRMTSASFEGGQPADRLFVFEVLDIRLNLWNYVFYIAAAAGLYQLPRYRKNTVRALVAPQSALMLYSLCLVLPLALLLTFARTKNDWYLAPAFFFIACLTGEGIVYFARFRKGVWIGAALLGVFTLARHAAYINSCISDTGQLISRSAPFFQNDRKLVVIGAIRQDVYLYLVWTGKPITAIRQEELAQHSGDILVTDVAQCTPVLADKTDATWKVLDCCIGILR